MEFARHKLLQKLKLSAADAEFLLSFEGPPAWNPRSDGYELESWISVLPLRLQELIASARGQEWPFLPPYVHSDWLTASNTKLPHLQENIILLRCLLLAAETNSFTDLSAITFVLDRFMYMYGGTGSIIDLVDMLHSYSPNTPVAPQLRIRRARLLKDKGDLHGAMRALDQVTSTDGRCTDVGSWQYKSRSQYDNVKAVCIQIKGQILHNLGLWNEAVPFLVDSVIGFGQLPVADEKGISSSQGLLSKCLKNITPVEYNVLRKQFQSFTQAHPCHEAYNQAVSAAKLCPNQSLFKARHILEAGDSLLRFAVQQDWEMRIDVLHKALQQLTLSLSQHDSESLRSREQCYQLVQALYLSSVSLMFSTVQTDVHLAWILEELCIALYTIYCEDVQAGFGHKERAAQLTNLAFLFLRLPELNMAPNTDSLQSQVKDLSLEERKPEADSDCVKTDKETNENKEHDDINTVDSGCDGEFPGEPQHSHKINNADLAISKNVADQTKDTHASDDTESLARQRYVGLPADPRSSLFTVVSPELYYNNPTEESYVGPPQVDTAASTIGTLPPAQVDPSATTMCSTYAIDALRSLESLVSSSSSEDSTTDSGCEVLHDEIDFVHPLVNLKPVEQSNTQLRHAEIEDFTKYMREVHDIVESNYNNICNKSGAARGRLWQYDPLNKQWSPQSTLVYVGDKVDLKKGKKGAHRDAIHIEFLHQDEPLGKYVGKRYRRTDRGLGDYLQDVECQMTARYYVTLFNQKLQSMNTEEKEVSQIQYLPAAHLQLLSPHGQIVDMLNVEPYLTGDSEFIKLTNNDAFFQRGVNQHILDTGLAFTHFTYEESQRQTMVVDLQGWMPKGDTGVLYLTDPQFHSAGGAKSSPFDRKEIGMMKFWQTVHPKCNHICELLKLGRPAQK